MHRWSSLPAYCLAAACAAPSWAHVEHIAAADSPAVLDDLRAVAQDRPRACPSATVQTPRLPPGWTAEPPRCAWRGLLRVQRWHAAPRATSACIGLPARYWAWMRTRFGQPMRAQSLAWDMQWSSNAVRVAGENESRIAVVVRNRDRSWTATEWHWTGSARKATRAWQQGRWHLLEQAAATIQPAPAAALPGEAVMLRAAWEDSLRGRAAENDGALWRWQAGSTCLAIDAVGLSDAQVQMPYHASESRLEQRAAMQLLMARRYPGVEWLAPFSLMPSAGGARYLALWRSADQVHGQLWIPRKDDSAIVKVRLTAQLPPGRSEQAGGPLVFHTVRAITGEMAALVSAWDARHER